MINPRIFTHVVTDSAGYELRRFESKRDAMWFIFNKPWLRVVSTGKKQLTKKEKELQAYNHALSLAGDAPF